MKMPFKATVVVLSAAAISGCDRSQESMKHHAVPDESEYGIVTAPQLGGQGDQPNFDNQAGVTTATTAASATGSTAPRLGDQPTTPTAQSAGAATTETATETTTSAAGATTSPASS